MAKYIPLNLIILCLFVSCTNNIKQEAVNKIKQDTVNNNQSAFISIDIASILKDPQQVKLSTIADSIRYIKLETTPNCLLSDILLTAVTDEYIFLQTSEVIIKSFNLKGMGNLFVKLGR